MPNSVIPRRPTRQPNNVSVWLLSDWARYMITAAGWIMDHWSPLSFLVVVNEILQPGTGPYAISLEVCRVNSNLEVPAL